MTFLPGIYFLRNVKFLASDKNRARLFSAVNDTTDGVFLGLGFFHMMPEMLETAEHIGISLATSLTSLLITIILFVCLSFVYRKVSLLVTKNDCDRLCCSTPMRINNIGLLLSAIMILSFHSISEGVALGFTVKSNLFIVLFAAIAFHKWLESFVVASALHGYASNWGPYLIMAMFSCMTPLGLVAGGMGLHQLLNQTPEFNLILYTFSSALFVYIGISCILSSRKREQSTTFRFVILGLLLILAFELLGYHLGVHAH